jgi:hypothetical protein
MSSTTTDPATVPPAPPAQILTTQPKALDPNEFMNFYDPIAIALCVLSPIVLLTPRRHLRPWHKPTAGVLLTLGIEGQVQKYSGHSMIYWVAYPGISMAWRRREEAGQKQGLDRVEALLAEEVRLKEEERRREVLREVEARSRRVEVEEAERREVEARERERRWWDIKWSRVWFWSKDGDRVKEKAREG